MCVKFLINNVNYKYSYSINLYSIHLTNSKLNVTNYFILESFKFKFIKVIDDDGHPK